MTTVSCAIRFIVASCLSLAFASAVSADGASLPQVLEGVSARSKAVFSGRLDFHLQSGLRAKREIWQDYNERFSFSGPNWALRIPNGNVRVNYDGKLLAFGQSEQPDKKIYRALRIQPAQPPNKHSPFPPYFAGTFWHDLPLKFMQANAAKGRAKEQTDVRGIRTTPLEWDVARPGDAFDSYNNVLFAGGLLRVYVAPQLGYALPRYEYVGRDGTVGVRFDAWEFEEAAPGVFFPHQCTCQCFDPAPVYYVDYKITKFEKINEPIPDDDFIIKIPEGTSVHDGRGPTVVAFFAGKTPPPEFDQGLDKLVRFEGESSGFWRSPTFAILVGVSLGVGLLAVFIWMRRRRQAPAQ